MATTYLKRKANSTGSGLYGSGLIGSGGSYLKRKSSLSTDRYGNTAQQIYDARNVRSDDSEENVGGFFGGLGYLGHKIGLGVTSWAEGVVDFTVGGLADLFGADELAEDIIANDWVDYDSADKWFKPSDGWKVAGDVAQGIGNSLPSLGINIGVAVATGGLSLPAQMAIMGGSSFLSAGLSAAGQGVKEAYQETGRLGGAEWGYGALSGATEGVIEGTSDAFLGGVGGTVARMFGKKAVSSVARTGIIKTSLKAFESEAFEEATSAVVSPFLKRLTYDKDAENATAQEVLYSAAIGGLSGLIMGGGSAALNNAQTAVRGANLTNQGKAQAIMSISEEIAGFESLNKTELKAFQSVSSALSELKGSLSKTGGEISTVRQKMLVGYLERANVAAAFQPQMIKEATNIVSNAEAVAETLNRFYADNKGVKMNVTAKALTDGIDFTNDAAFKKTLPTAIENNQYLRELVVMQMAGKMMMDTEEYGSALLKGQGQGLLVTQRALDEFKVNASEQKKAAVSKALGVDINTVSLDEFNARLGVRNEYTDGVRFAREAKRVGAENVSDSLPSAVSEQNEGIVRYRTAAGDVAIQKSADGYRFYLYDDAVPTVKLGEAQANELLQEIKNGLEVNEADANAGVDDINVGVGGGPPRTSVPTSNNGELSITRINSEKMHDNSVSSTNYRTENVQSVPNVPSENVQEVTKNAPEGVQNDSRRYAFSGYADDGKGMYRSNFPKGTPKKAKGERILKYIQDVWSKKPIKLNITDENGNTVRTIEAQFDPFYDETEHVLGDAAKLMGGNRHGTASEQRVTLDLADDYYQIASESKYNYSKKETGKNHPAHKNVKEWHYFVNDIYFAEYDSKEYNPYTVSINVKEKADGNFVYSFSAEENIELGTRRTLHADVNRENSANTELDDSTIIHQDEAVVNTSGEKSTVLSSNDKSNDNSKKQTVRERVTANRISMWVRENVEGFEKLNASEQLRVKSIAISAAAHGFSNEDIGSICRVAMHSGLEISFDRSKLRIPLSDDPSLPAARELPPKGKPQGEGKYALPSSADVAALRSIGRKSINAFTSEDIKKAEPWARKFNAELGVKSPFFRAWFGDWRAYDTNSLQKVVAEDNKKLENGRSTNKDTQKIISWNAHDIISETKNHAVKDKVSVEAINQLDEIIEKAVLLDTVISEPTSKSKMPNTAFMHSFYTVYENKSGRYLLKLFVEEALSNNEKTVFTRAYQLKDIQKVANLPNGVSEGTPSLSDDKSATIDSIADLFALVKQFDKDFSPKDVNPLLLNEDGTPKVFYHGTSTENGDFTVFDYSKAVKRGGVGLKALGKGNYFTSKKLDGSERYGSRVISAYLNITNPFVYNGGRSIFEQFEQEYGVKVQGSNELQQAMRDAGFDGVIKETGGEMLAVAFDSEQIKSATDNIGTFDGKNPDIRYAKRGLNDPSSPAARELPPKGKPQGEGLYADGMYKDGVIYIDPQSERAIPALLSHEMLHAVYGKDAAKMLKLAYKNMSESEKAEIKADYGIKDDTDSEYREEIAAHYAEKILGSESGLAYLWSEEPTLKEKILDFFKGAQGAYAADEKLDAAARKFARQYRNLFKKLEASGGLGAYRSGEARHSRITVNGKYYEPDLKTLIDKHPNIKVTVVEDAKYEKNFKMSDAEYVEYRFQQTNDAKKKYGIYTNKDTAYSDTYGEINAEFGSMAVGKNRFHGGVALYDIMPYIGNIFENAIVINTKADKNADANIKGVVNLVGGAVLKNDNLAIVKLNVKEYANNEAKIYDNLIIEIEELTVVGGIHHIKGDEKSPAVSSDYIIRAFLDFVKTEEQKKSGNGGKRFAKKKTPGADPAFEAAVANYSYDALIAKDDIIVADLPDSLPFDEKGHISKEKVRRAAVENAKLQKNINNTENDTYVYVPDIGKNVRINRKGLDHGLARSPDTALATMRIGDILGNAVTVNELEGRTTDKKQTDMSYVLLGVAKNKDGAYLVRIIVDKNTNAVSEISSYGLYAVKAKKDGAIFTLKSDEGEEAAASIPYLGSTISIAQLLDSVKGADLANSVFSKDVLQKLGIERGKNEFSGMRYAKKKTSESDPAFQAAVARAQGASETAENQSLQEKFRQEYDTWDKADPRKSFTVGKTSNVLRRLGVKDTKIKWDASKIIKIKSKHAEMTDEIIKQVPKIIDDPIVVFKSMQSDSRLTLFGEVYAENKPILAVLELDPTGRNGVSLNDIKIASAYGKDNAQGFIDRSKLLYVDSNEKRISEWEKRTGLQLPVGSSQADPIGRAAGNDSLAGSEEDLLKSGVPNDIIPDAEQNVKGNDKNSIDTLASVRTEHRDSYNDTLKKEVREAEGIREKAKAFKKLSKEKIFTSFTAAKIEIINEYAGVEDYLQAAEIKGSEATVQMVRSSLSRAHSMISFATYDTSKADKKGEIPEITSKGLEQIFAPVNVKGKVYKQKFYNYLFHMHNVDRMSLQKRSMQELADLKQELDEKEAKIKESYDKAAKEYAKVEKAHKNALFQQKQFTARAEGTKENQKKYKEGSPEYIRCSENIANWEKKAAEFSKEAAKYQKAADKMLQLQKKLEKFQKSAKEQIDSFVVEDNKPVFGKNEDVGRDHDITADESDAIAKEYEANNPEFRAKAEEVWAFIDELNKMRVTHGLISQADYDYMKKKYPHYVPTYRETHNQGIAAVDGRRNSEVRKTVSSAKGGGQALLPIDESIAKQVMQVSRAGAVNVMANKIYDAQKKLGDTTYVEIIEKKRVSRKEAVEADYEAERPKANQVTFYRNGDKITMKVCNEIFYGFDAIHGMINYENPLLKFLAGANKGFKELVTSKNPLFLARNKIKDVQDAGFNTKYPKQFLKNLTTGRAERMIANNDPLWQLYVAMGGFSSSVFDLDKGFDGSVGKRGFKTVRTFKDGNNAVSKTWNGSVGRVFDQFENINAFAEQTTRFNEFVASIEAGNSAEQALLDAAEVTTNFGRKGRLIKHFNATISPFLNPSIQGFDKLLRNIGDAWKEKSLKAILELLFKIAFLGLAPQIISELFYADDEDYQMLRDTDKANYYLFKIGDNFLKIPKGRVNSAFAGAVEQVARIPHGERVEIGEYLKNVASNVTPHDSIARNLLSPFYDVQNNKTWYGGTIEGRQFENVAPRDRYDESTSSIAIWIGQKFNYSPKKIHYLIDQYSGVIGDILLPVTSKKAEKDPVSAAFTLDYTSSNNLSDKFYKLYDETQYAKTAGDETAEYQIRHLNRVKKSVNELYDEIKLIQASDKPTAEKYNEVRAIRILINNVYKTALTDFDLYTKAIEATEGIFTGGIFEDETDERFSEETRADIRFAEATRLMYGAEAALEVYNKKIYEKCQLLNKIGISYDLLYAEYFTTRGLESDLDKNGKAIAGTKRKKIVRAISAMPTLSREQKLLLICSKGYSIKDGDVRGVTAARAKQLLLRYIRSLNVSAEERAALAEMCGFEVRNGRISLE